MESEQLKEEITKKECPEQYELYKKYDKWALIHIIKAKDDVIKLHKKFKNTMEKF